jgi:hypothetical protein
MLLGNCKEKIKKVSTAFAIALMSARLEQTVCYTLGGFSAVSLNTAFVSAYTETNYSIVPKLNLVCCRNYT